MALRRSSYRLSVNFVKATGCFRCGLRHICRRCVLIYRVRFRIAIGGRGFAVRFSCGGRSSSVGSVSTFWQTCTSAIRRSSEESDIRSSIFLPTTSKNCMPLIYAHTKHTCGRPHAPKNCSAIFDVMGRLAGMFSKKSFKLVSFLDQAVLPQTANRELWKSYEFNPVRNLCEHVKSAYKHRLIIPVIQSFQRKAPRQFARVISVLIR